MRVPSNLPGVAWILCNWAECSRDGDDRYKTVVTREAHDEGEATWAKLTKTRLTSTHLFCSERHKMMWVNSPKDNNNLPSGMRGMLT